MINQGVHLKNDPPVAMFALTLDLVTDHVHQALPQSNRGDQQRAVGGLATVGGEEVEEIHHIGGDVGAAGKQPQVGVDAGGAGVIVAGAHVDVAANALLFLTHHHRQLGMNLQPQQPIDNMHPGALHRLGPDDIVLLIEAGLQFHDRRHLLTLLAGVNERLHNGRVAANAVESLLNRQHMRVFGGSLDKVNYRREGVVGVMQQHIALTDRVKNIAAATQHRWQRRHMRRILEVGPINL